MAEALRSEKTADDANAVYSTFLEDPAEIAQALKTLRNQRVKVRITFENEAGIFRARILDVLDGELLLEDLQPRSALALMNARCRFSFSGRGEGIYLYAEENRVRRIDEERGVPYFRVPLPANILFQQRRRTARYQLPYRTDGNPVLVELKRNVRADKDHDGTLTARMLDVSAGGCRVAIPGPVHPPLEAGEVLVSATLSIPTLFDLHAEATLRHATYNKLTRTVICGLEFTGMDITDRRRLEQFIQSIALSQGRG